MSRSNYDKPFYVDVGTSIVAVRCGSNSDVVFSYDHSRYPLVIELAEKACDRMNREAAICMPRRNCDRFGGDIDKLREACARERGLNPEEDFPDVFPDWLLALSTEKKGGAK